jgi:myo-inositol-1(or 4)-monophosphatase
VQNLLGRLPLTASLENARSAPSPHREREALDAAGLRPHLNHHSKVIMLHSAVLNVMIKAAHRAGRSLKRDLGEIEHLQVSLKGPGNFVTAADRRAEEIVREELAKARPDYGFLGEEGGAREGSDKSHRWIVDPLDGTTNFLHGIPHFAVSIALERNGAIVAGVVSNPANDELFVAERGKGAFLNDKRIRVAARQRLADAVVACGLPHFGRGDLALARHEIAAAQQHFAGLRRYGAATLDLAWVAAGRLDAYWERNLSPWDLAAGSILVREAGGFVSDLDGGDAIFTKGQIVAGNETMHSELLRLLKEASKETAAP